jgi:hypothetical protein
VGAQLLQCSAMCVSKRLVVHNHQYSSPEPYICWVETLDQGLATCRQPSSLSLSFYGRVDRGGNSDDSRGKDKSQVPVTYSYVKATTSSRTIVSCRFSVTTAAPIFKFLAASITRVEFEY